MIARKEKKMEIKANIDYKDADVFLKGILEDFRKGKIRYYDIYDKVLLTVEEVEKAVLLDRIIL